MSLLWAPSDVARPGREPLWKTYGDNPVSINDSRFRQVEARLRAFLADKPGRFSIYFEDLTTGESFGINPDEPLPAASVVKVPIVLYLYQRVAEGRDDLNRRIAYEPEVDYEGGDGVLRYVVREGDTYSLRVLANLAITISDNIATRMLIRHLGKRNIIGFMRSLGAKTVYPGGKNIATARDAATYFKAVLRFAKERPELGRMFLDDLANSIYHVGLPGGVPKEIVVAHKEGSLDDVADDAGVVFAPRPFIVAVFSADIPDVDQGFLDIAEISRIIYEFQAREPH